MSLAIPHRDPEFSSTDTVPQATLGGLHHYHDATYGFWILMYAQLHGAADATQYAVCEVSDQGLGCVTVDRNDDMIALVFGGVCCGSGTAASGHYLYVVKSGRYYLQTDGGVAAADALVVHTTDSQADTIATGLEQSFGFALTADTTPATYYATAQLMGL